MRLTFCGVRGSTPSPGSDFVRYGGSTSCLAVSDGAADPALVIDGGTGLRQLDELLADRPFCGTVLLGHLHWDHTHGLPFWRTGGSEDAVVRVVLPEQGDAEAVLARAFSPPHFPVPPRALGPGWSFHSLEPGRHTIEGYDVLALDIPHKGGRTFGYRVTDGTATFAYLSDHSPVVHGAGDDGLGALHDAALELASGVDLLIHDAQHTAEEFPQVAALGHAAVDYAVTLADAAQVRALALFHHSPSRTDDEIDSIVAAIGRPTVFAAYEGLVLELSRSRTPGVVA